MASPLGPLRLIVNPLAGGRTRKHVVPTLRTGLEERGVEHDVVETAGPADAEALARSAVEEGVRYLVAVGGDGTLHGLVNGVFDGEAPRAEGIVVGVVPTGSGSDFARTVGLHMRPELAVGHLASEATMPVDVGVASFTGADGQPATRLFLNLAEVGYGAEVVRLAQRLPRALGRFRYLLAAWGGIRAVRRQPARVELAHAGSDLELVELVVANGQFFGGGMRVAPRALPDDGRFNVLAFTGDRGQVFRLTTQMFQGRHLPDPHIREWQSPHVTITTEHGLRVEADGESLGTTPASFRLLPRALAVKI